MHNNRSSANRGAVTDSDLPNNSSAHSDEHLVSDSWDIVWVRASLTNRHMVEDRDRSSDFATRIDNDTPPCMGKLQPWPAPNLCRQLCPDQDLDPDEIQDASERVHEVSTSAAPGGLIEPEDNECRSVQKWAVDEEVFANNLRERSHSLESTAPCGSACEGGYGP